MGLINAIIQNIIYIIVPLLLYSFYAICQTVKNEKKNDIYFFMCLFTSLYLFFKYGTAIHDDKIRLFCNIPIIIAYYKRKPLMGIILSGFVVMYLYCITPNMIIIIMAFKYFVYFITYLILNKKEQIEQNYINAIAVLQGFFISFEYFCTRVYEKDFMLLLEVFLLVVLLYIITFSIIYIYKIGDRANDIYLSYNDLKKEKHIRDSLFKITHEIKNPIAVCKGYIDMFDVDNVEKSNKYIGIIKQEIERTLNILNDFSEIGKIKIEKEIFDINLLIEDTIDSVLLLYGDKNVKINYHKKLFEVYINGDYNRLKQVFVNILKNSFESITKKRGLIEVITTVEKNYFCLTILDNGNGMDEYTLGKIREVFYTTKKYGSGLGIPLSMEIIEAHLGEITYESQLKKGTKTIIKLPIDLYV